MNDVSQPIIDSNAAKTILKSLKEQYTNEVVRYKTNVEDYIKNEFLPKVQSIRQSNEFSNLEEDILEIESTVASYRNRLMRALGEDEEQDLRLKAIKLVGRKLTALSEFLGNVPVSFGGNETTLKTRSEVISIEKLQSEQYYRSTDKNYAILKPPANAWQSRTLNMISWMAENLEIKDPSVMKMLFETEAKRLTGQENAEDIVVFESNNQIEIIPIPGKTLISDRSVPTGSPVVVNTKLSILPMNRFPPPFFFERSLLENFLNRISPMMSLGLVKLRSFSVNPELTNQKKAYVKAEFSQELKDVIIHDKEIKEATANTVVVGFEGEIKDYFLIMRYVTISGARDEILENEIRTLRSLVESFSPVKIIEGDKELDHLRKQAEEKFNEIISPNKVWVFWLEFDFQILKFSGLDLNDAKNRERAMSRLKHFQEYAKQVNLGGDSFLNTLWTSIKSTEQGKPSDFTELVHEYVEQVKLGKGMSSSAVFAGSTTKKLPYLGLGKEDK